MNKTVRPEANEQLLAELGSLISVVEPGQMRKLASSNSMTRDMLNQHKPDKDHFLIHVIGLGDYETYGFNRNADAFTKQANQDYHHTFVSDGHMFREHNNGNPSLKIGDIKASVHNDDMNRVELAVWGHKKKASDVRDKLHAGEPISVSMSCFTAGTLVRTPEGSIPIESVEEGDLVYSHDGSAQRVYETMVRDADTLYDINIRLFGKPQIKTTAEHPFYCLPLGPGLRGGNAKRNRESKEAASAYLEDRLQWVEAKDLTRNHYLAVPIRKESNPNLKPIEDPAWAKLLGYILGDGSVIFCKGNPNSVCFTCHVDDLLLREVDLLLQEIGSQANFKNKPHALTSQAVAARLHSAELARAALRDLHGHAAGKRVPEALFDASEECIFAFFSGWVNSDGWQDYKGIHISSVDRDRCVDGMRLLASIGVPASITKIHHKPDGNFGRDESDEYVLNISNWFSPRFTYGLQKVEDLKGDVRQDQLMISENYFYIPIKSVTPEVVEPTPVYNLSVENTHTYNVFDLAVHNCHVPFDVDSCTGKKARSPAEYESHMRRTPGQFVPGFDKYAFVYNPNPRFFDISYVKRPADRIAHHLEHFLGDEDNVEMAKAASEHGVVSGALLAEIEGVTTPDWLNTTGIHNPTKRGILQKLATAEKTFHNALAGEATSDLVTFVKEAAAYAFDGTDDLTDPEINTLRRVQPETLFQELGKRAAFLPFRTFLSYATGKTLRELDEDPAVKEAALMLPEVFDLMEHDCVVEDETMFDGHKSSFLSRADLANTDEVQRVFDKCDERYSAKTEKVKPRAVSIRITTTKTVEPEEKKEKQEKKAFANDSLPAKYAQLYGLYKVAAVEQATKDANYTLDNQFFMYLISQHNL